MQETLLIVTLTFKAIKTFIKYPAAFHLDLPKTVKSYTIPQHFNMLTSLFWCNKKLTPIIYVKVKVKQSLYRPITGPEGSRRLRLPDFETIGS